MRNFRLEPLVACHHRNAQDFCLWRLNQQEHRLLICPTGTSGILIDNDLALLLRKGSDAHCEEHESKKPVATKGHHLTSVADVNQNSATRERRPRILPLRGALTNDEGSEAFISKTADAPRFARCHHNGRLPLLLSG